MGHSVKLHGGVTFDWMFATSDPSKLPDGNIITAEPGWSGTTSMLATFKTDIAASDYSGAETSVMGYRIYKKTGDTGMVFVAEITSGTKFLHDYGIRSGDDTVYLIYPITTDESGKTVYSAPVVTSPIKVDCETYTLVDLVQNDDKSFIVGNYVWSFYVNAETIDFSHNMQTITQETHSRYPHVRRGSQNYVSGSLSAYAGYVVEGGKYVEDQHVFDKWTSFLNSTEPKLLTDPFGHKYIVEVTNSSHKTEDYFPAPTVISFDFAEIANADDYSVYAEIVE